MKLAKITGWIDKTLDVPSFDDVSNNGLQIARDAAPDDIRCVAFAVDASLASVKDAIAAGAQLLVVHHGISWRGGVRRIDGGIYRVVKAAMDANLALYAVHIPLDASRVCGNNWEIARHLKLKRVRPAFAWRGKPVGIIGEKDGFTVGICSGGSGSCAVEAKELGCDVFVTGEADWGEKIAAENVGIAMLTCGHYETETFGVNALARLMGRRLRIRTVFIPRRED